MVGGCDIQCVEPYKVLAAQSDDQPSFKPIFYPKKIDLEVENMLMGENLSRVSFYAWWKSANQSRDFWIEDRNHLVRVHVVPRTKPFDPSLWQTSLNELKTKLLDTLGDHMQVDVIPCHGEGLVQFAHHGPWRSHHNHELGKGFDRLWIGRNRFEKRVTRAPEESAHVCAAVAMEDEARRHGEGARELPGGDPPAVECAGASTDHCRTEGVALSQEGKESGDWPHQDVAQGVDRDCRGVGPHRATEADTGPSAKDDSRSSSTSWRASDDVREVQKLVVPRSAGGVYGLGGEGDQGECQRISRPQALCDLGRRGTSTPGREIQGGRLSGGERGSGSQGGDHTTGCVVSPKLEVFTVEHPIGEDEREACTGGERHGGGEGNASRSQRGGCKRVDGFGDEVSSNSTEESSSPSWISAMMQKAKAWCGGGETKYEAVLENSATVGLGCEDGQEAMLTMLHESDSELDGGHVEAVNDNGVGSGKSEYVDTVGPCSEKKYEADNVYVDTVGPSSEAKYEEDIEYKATVGQSNYEPTGSSVAKEMRERAVAGIRKRRNAKKSVRKKLIGMANSLHQVLLASAFVVGAMANNTVVEPSINLIGNIKDQFVGGGDEHPSCAEIFAGSANITGAFAQARQGVMRPVDILYGQDLRRSEVQEEVFEEIKEKKPRLVWCAPPCTEYCAFSRLNYTKQERRRRRKREKVFLEFIDRVIVLQLAEGRDVVVENPMTSDMWKEPLMARWCSDRNMSFFRTDLCHFWLLSTDGAEKLRKPIKLLASNPVYQEHLGQLCDGDHDHRVIQGKETKHSAEYPEGFAKAVVRAADSARAKTVFTAEDVAIPDAADSEADEMISRGSEDITFKGTVKSQVAGAVRRLHQNLGHPPNRELIKHLRLGGGGEEMIAAVEAMRCRTCQRCADPKPHRVSKPAALLDFNDAVALDIIFLDTTESTGNLALNMVDIASSYQVAIPIPNRRSSTVSEAFYCHWISWAGVPGRLVLDLDTCFQDSFWELTSDHSIAMRAAAGQAHWQNGVAERYGSGWKSIWTKLCAQHGVQDRDILDAACAVSEARNTLRNRSGFSPRQWVFGTNGKLLPNMEDDEDWSAISAVTADTKMGRKHSLKIGARTAFFELQNVDSLKRAISHKTRVQPRDYKPGDMVYIYRQDPSGKKSKARWIGPATIIGAEGSNFWTARGGRCILAAREHLRSADHEEVSFALRIKAAVNEVQKTLDKEFEDVVEDEAMPEIDLSGVGDDEDVAMTGGSGPTGSNDPDPGRERRRKAEQIEVQHKSIVKQARLLDDVPASIKQNIQSGKKQVFYVNKKLVGDALEKALDKELPWNMIPDNEKDMYRDAEAKQWKEHIDFGAVRPLTLEETKEVEARVSKDRIISSRFLYRDKNRAKRRLDDNIECKPKARLCVGGQRDPDLGVVEMSVDAPTASRHSILIGLMVALARQWKVAVGDIRAAFLNGVEAPRDLYFRQPVRGIPGLHPRQLIEIIKGVFGLATSPKLWWIKLSTDLVTLVVEWNNEMFKIQQNEIDPCAFRVVSEKDGRVAGMLFTHVDDIMVMAENGLDGAIKDAIAKHFPIDEWESDSFEYVGCEYKVEKDKVTITQTTYAKTRVEKVTLPSGINDEDEANPDLILQHRSTVGALSWLAKQTRPDLQFSVAQAQRIQNHPTYGDIKQTNKIVEMARKHADQGIVLKAIPEEHLHVYGFHDAAWGNVHVDEVPEVSAEWEGKHALGSQLGSLVLIGGKRCLENQEAACCVVDWRSKASTRVCRSTFAGETMACGDALEGALFLRGLLVSFLHGKLVSEGDAGKYIPIHLFTDCRSLFDHLHRDGIPKPPSEKRLAIELAAIRQALAIESKHQWFKKHGRVPLRPDRPLKPPIHWLPTDQQWSDILTKKMSGTAWWAALGEGMIRFPLTVPKENPAPV